MIPIYKAGDSQQFSNYRPVSILPIISKIFEKVIYKRLISYIDKNNILTPYQFGFRQNMSTSLALTFFVDKINSAIENKQFSIGIFLDLSKAFDTVNHHILLQKLSFYGVRGIALDWFKDYLTNRCQKVYYNKVHSQYRSIVCGVPQGSIIGPLLFLLYINDLPNTSQKANFVLFADDTNLLFTGPDINELLKDINTELKNNY